MAAARSAAALRCFAAAWAAEVFADEEEVVVVVAATGGVNVLRLLERVVVDPELDDRAGDPDEIDPVWLDVVALAGFGFVDAAGAGVGATAGAGSGAGSG